MYSNSNQSTPSHSRWENSKWTKWNGTTESRHGRESRTEISRRRKPDREMTAILIILVCVKCIYYGVCDVYEKWDRINCMEIPWKNLRKSYWELRKCMTTHTQIRLKWYEFLLIGVASESKGGWANRGIIECKMCVYPMHMYTISLRAKL